MSNEHSKSLTLIQYLMHFSNSFRLIEKHKDTSDKQNVAEVTDLWNKRNAVKNIIIKELKMLLECDDIDASELYYNHVYNINELDWAKENIQLLLDMSVSRIAIRKHGSLLTLPYGKVIAITLSEKLLKMLIATEFFDNLQIKLKKMRKS